MRELFDHVDRLIGQADAAARALSADATLAVVVATLKPVLGAYVPARPEFAGACVGCPT